MCSKRTQALSTQTQIGTGKNKGKQQPWKRHAGHKYRGTDGDKETNDRQTDDRQTDRQTEHRQTNRQTETETETHTQTQTHTHTHTRRQGDRQRQTTRWTDLLSWIRIFKDNFKHFGEVLTQVMWRCPLTKEKNSQSTLSLYTMTSLNPDPTWMARPLARMNASTVVVKSPPANFSFSVFRPLTTGIANRSVYTRLYNSRMVYTCQHKKGLSLGTSCNPIEHDDVLKG